MKDSGDGDSVKDTDHDGIVDGQDKCPTDVVTDPAGNTATDSTTFTVDPSASSGSGTGSNKPGEPGSVERNLLGGGIGCAASGGAPSALAMMGLAVLGALRMRRRQR